MGAISSGSHENPSLSESTMVQPSENEVRLSYFMEASLCAALTLDENYAITYANRRAAELFGYEPEELLGRPFFETFAILEDSILKNVSIISSQTSNEKPDFDWDLETERVQTIALGLRKTGAKIWMSWKFLPKRDEKGEIIEVFCVGNDLADKNEEIARSQLHNHAGDSGYWNVNLKSGKILAGNQWFAIRGLAAAQDNVNIKLWFEDIHTQDYPTVRRLWKKHLRDQSSPFTAEFRFLNHEKGWIWIRSTGHVSEWDEQGQPLWISGFDQDITQERLDAETLKNRQNLLNEVIRIGQMGYWVYDYNINSTVAVSDTLYEILGISRQNVSYKTFFDYLETLIHAEDRQRVFEVVFSTAAMERKTECRVYTNQGKMIFVQIHSRPMIDAAGRATAQITIIKDITESKKVEHTLREQQLSLFYALRVSHAGFWQFHLETGHLDVSNDTTDFFCDINTKGPIGFEKMMKNWIYPADYDRVWQILSHAVAEGGTFEFECRILNRMKNVRYVRQSGIIHLDENQNETKILGVVLDISDIIQREKEIQKSEARYRILFDHSFNAVTVFENKKIIQCNERAVELFQASSKNDLIGRSASILFPEIQPDGHFSLEIFYDLMHQCTKSHIQPFTMLAHRFNGTEFTSSVSLSPVGGDDSLVFAVIHDVTEKNIVAKTMEYYRAYLAVLAELRDQFYGRSERDIIVAFLGSVTKHFGVSKTWYGVHHQNAIHPVLHAGDSQNLLDVLRVDLFEQENIQEFPLSKAIRNRKAVIFNQSDDAPQTGALVSFLKKTKFRSVLAVPLEVDDSLEGGFVFYSYERGVFEDFVSNYLQTGIRELSRILYEKRLWEKHHHMLEQAKETAEAAAKAKTQFLANMSHEIRTPMTAILGYAEMLCEKIDSPDFRTKIATTIKNNASFLLHILNDILDFSKIEADKVLLEYQKISLPQMLADIYVPYFLIAEKKGIKFEINNTTPLPQTIVSDPVRIQQVLLNLIGNALKFTVHGGVKLVVSWLWNHDIPPKSGDGNNSRTDNTIEPGFFSYDTEYESCFQVGDSPTASGNGFLRFEIFDTGIGITPDQMDMIFSPFNQADTSTTRQFGGTGLGLAISQRLTHLLGGQMTVASTYGFGSVFAFVVPQELVPDCVFMETLNLTPPAPLRNGNTTTSWDQTLDLLIKEHSIASPSLVSNFSHSHDAKKIDDTPANEIVAPKPQTKLLSGLRILLAEDGLDNQRLFSLILTKAGAEVVLVDNGADVLKTLHDTNGDTETGDNRFDIILMDIQMPIMDGYTATRKLRELGDTIPIVALTAHAMVEERSKCLDAGCDDYATKPIMKDALIQVVLKNARKTTEFRKEVDDVIENHRSL